MGKKGQGFTANDKARIMGAETQKHGQIRRGSFASKVQKLVDTTQQGVTPRATETPKGPR